LVQLSFIGDHDYSWTISVQTRKSRKKNGAKKRRSTDIDSVRTGSWAILQGGDGREGTVLDRAAGFASRGGELLGQLVFG